MTAKVKKPPVLGYRLAFAALQVLHKNNGPMSFSDVREEVYRLKEKDIPPKAKEKYPTLNNVIKWVQYLQTGSGWFAASGLLRKSGGAWYLTAEGEKALSREEDKVIQEVQKVRKAIFAKRRRLKNENLSDDDDSDAAGEARSESETADAKFEHYESEARNSIENHIRELGPYEFQDLCAALLRGMGYYVRHVSPPGPDGGIDIVAYQDPLGAKAPRLKVQVKNLTDKADRPALSQLAGLLTTGDNGIFISSSGFTSKCQEFARGNDKHLELIDLTRFIELWKKCYDNLSEEDKVLLPLQPIYFLDPKRAAKE